MKYFCRATITFDVTELHKKEVEAITDKLHEILNQELYDRNTKFPDDIQIEYIVSNKDTL